LQSIAQATITLADCSEAEKTAATTTPLKTACLDSAKIQILKLQDNLITSIAGTNFVGLIK